MRSSLILKGILAVFIVCFFSCHYPHLDEFVYVTEEPTTSSSSLAFPCDSILESSSDSLINEYLRLDSIIEDLRLEVIIAIGSDSVNRTLVAGADLDNTELPAEIIYHSLRAQKLKEELHNYQGQLISAAGDSSLFKFYLLQLQDRIDYEGMTETWEKRSFLDVPAAAVVTILSYLRSDLKNLSCRYLEIDN